MYSMFRSSRPTRAGYPTKWTDPFRLNVPNDSIVELSHKGFQFLANLFERHDKDKDGALSPKEVKAIFATCPVPAFTACVRHLVPTNSKVSFGFWLISLVSIIDRNPGSNPRPSWCFVGMDHHGWMVLLLDVHYVDWLCNYNGIFSIFRLSY